MKATASQKSVPLNQEYSSLQIWSFGQFLHQYTRKYTQKFEFASRPTPSSENLFNEESFRFLFLKMSHNWLAVCAATSAPNQVVELVDLQYWKITGLF